MYTSALIKVIGRVQNYRHLVSRAKLTVLADYEILLKRLPEEHLLSVFKLNSIFLEGFSFFFWQIIICVY